MRSSIVRRCLSTRSKLRKSIFKPRPSSLNCIPCLINTISAVVEELPVLLIGHTILANTPSCVASLEAIGRVIECLEENPVCYAGTYDKCMRWKSKKVSKLTGEIEEFLWDAENKLIEYRHYPSGVSTPDRVAKYGYDGLGRRHMKEVNGIHQYILWNGDDEYES